MKKFILLFVIAAFTAGSLTGTTAQAAPHGKGLKVKHLQKVNHRLHHKVQQLRHKLHGNKHHPKNG